MWVTKIAGHTDYLLWSFQWCDGDHPCQEPGNTCEGWSFDWEEDFSLCQRNCGNGCPDGTKCYNPADKGYDFASPFCYKDRSQADCDAGWSCHDSEEGELFCAKDYQKVSKFER